MTTITGPALASAGTSAGIPDAVSHKLELPARPARRPLPLGSLGKSGRRGGAFEGGFWYSSKGSMEHGGRHAELLGRLPDGDALSTKLDGTAHVDHGTRTAHVTMTK
jgi:hypothetical protein